MNPYTYDMSHAVAEEKLSRLRAEADNYRLAKKVKPERVGAMDRLVQAIGQGLASLGERKARNLRPSLPTL